MSSCKTINQALFGTPVFLYFVKINKKNIKIKHVNVSIDEIKYFVGGGGTGGSSVVNIYIKHCIMGNSSLNVTKDQSWFKYIHIFALFALCYNDNNTILTCHSSCHTISYICSKVLETNTNTYIDSHNSE